MVAVRVCRSFSRGSSGAVPSPAQPGQFLRFISLQTLRGRLENRDVCLRPAPWLRRGERCWVLGCAGPAPSSLPSIHSVFLPVSLPSLGSHAPGDTRGEGAGLSLQVTIGSDPKSQAFPLTCEWEPRNVSRKDETCRAL